jgi:threonyl-tRNA synthetase
MRICIAFEKGKAAVCFLLFAGHCLMFGNRSRSYRELPLRLADFGVLHRNEFSGALQGLTRVRRFQQDDAHVFCRSGRAEMVVRHRARGAGQFVGIELGAQVLSCNCSLWPTVAHGVLHWRRCRQDQVKAEISAYLKMMGEVYDIFGLDYKMALSTRPEGYLGELELWNQAEQALEEALNATGREWEVRAGAEFGSCAIVWIC